MKSTRKCLTRIGKRAVIGGLLLFVVAANAQANDARGKQLYVNCIACHGDDGQGGLLMKAPALAPLSEKYIAAQLDKFKHGHRAGNPKDVTGLMMRPMLQTLPREQDIAAVSAYIASAFEEEPRKATLEGGDIERGKTLYATCQACHGANAEGNDLLNAPSLRGQYDWYLLAQLHKFKEGIRGANPEDITGSQMRPMAMTLADDQAMRDVVAYIQSLSE